MHITCRHVLEVHRAATQRREVAEEEAREEAFFKRYLEFCRARVSPRLSEPAANSLVSQYVELREQVGRLRPCCGFDVSNRRSTKWEQRRFLSSGCLLESLLCSNPFAEPVLTSVRHQSSARCSGCQAWAEFVTRIRESGVPDRCLLVQARAAARENESDTPVVPITVRQLEAVVRIAESYARMQLQVRLLLTALLMSTSKATVQVMSSIKSYAAPLPALWMHQSCAGQRRFSAGCLSACHPGSSLGLCR